MRKLSVCLAISIPLAACAGESMDDQSSEQAAVTDPGSSAEIVSETENVTLSGAEAEAAKACHDEVWLNTDAYKNLPNAAVSIVPELTEMDGTYTVPWTVEWSDPDVNASGTCSVRDGEVEISTD